MIIYSFIHLIETQRSHFRLRPRNTSHASVFDRTPEGMAGTSAKSAFWLCHLYGVEWPGSKLYFFSVVTQQWNELWGDYALGGSAPRKGQQGRVRVYICVCLSRSTWHSWAFCIVNALPPVLVAVLHVSQRAVGSLLPASRSVSPCVRFFKFVSVPPYNNSSFVTNNRHLSPFTIKAKKYSQNHRHSSHSKKVQKNQKCKTKFARAAPQERAQRCCVHDHHTLP